MPSSDEQKNPVSVTPSVNDDAQLDAAPAAKEEDLSLPSDAELAEEAKVHLIYSQLNDLHESVRKYLASEKLLDKRAKLYAKHKLTEDEQNIVGGIELAFFLEDISVEEFVDEFWQRMPWEDTAENEDRAVALALDVMGEILLPAQAFYGDIISEINLQGGDSSKYKAEPLETRVITYAEALDGILEALDVSEMDPASQKRLRYIVESRLRSVRDEDEMQRMLVKPRKTGGLEMAEDEAERITKIVHEEMRMTQYVEQLEGQEQEEESAAEETALYSAEDIKAILVGTVEEQKEISKRLQKLDESTDGDPEVLREVLSGYILDELVSTAENEDVIVALLLFVRRGNLTQTLLEDERYIDTLVNYFRSYKDNLSEKIKAEPAGPVAMNAFLQIVLRGVAQLPPADAARYGLRIINILKKKGESQYVELIAFDMDRGEFVWNDQLEL